MSFAEEYKKKLDNLTYFLNHINELKLSSNGGNTILFTCIPNQEKEYIDLLYNHFQDRAEFINIAELFVTFIRLKAELSV